MTKINLFNENCFDTMTKMVENNQKVDIVLTSPPYNTGRNSNSERSLNNYEARYDIHLDNMTDDEYCQWSVDLFNHYDKILNKDGVILYNISYGSESPYVMWLTMADIIRNTNFMVADVIVWKKKSALPNNTSKNKLTRITEFVFVICRKDEFKTFNTNKQIKSYSKTGQAYYENIFNFIEAPNNDGVCKLNKATYSSELCEKLLNIYAKSDSVVYDSFMGTGTTAVGCLNYNNGDNEIVCFGSELSGGQVEFAKDRLENIGYNFK